MEYKGKQYEEVTDGSGKIGDLLHVTKCYNGQCDVWCFTTDGDLNYPSVDKKLPNGYTMAAIETDGFTRYREIEKETKVSTTLWIYHR